MKKPRICTIADCGQSSRAKGLCQKCYTRRYRQQESPAQKEARRQQDRDWRKKNPDKTKAIYRKYRNTHLAKIKSHPERDSVRSHYAAIILRPKQTYVGLPFFNGWSPKCGGSFDVGAEWIITNIGRRPTPEYDLHIVNRLLGFVPDNLAWVPRKKHRQEEFVNRLLLENQNLRNEIAYLKAVL